MVVGRPSHGARRAQNPFPHSASLPHTPVIVCMTPVNTVPRRRTPSSSASAVSAESDTRSSPSFDPADASSSARSGTSAAPGPTGSVCTGGSNTSRTRSPATETDRRSSTDRRVSPPPADRTLPPAREWTEPGAEGGRGGLSAMAGRPDAGEGGAATRAGGRGGGTRRAAAAPVSRAERLSSTSTGGAGGGRGGGAPGLWAASLGAGAKPRPPGRALSHVARTRRRPCRVARHGAHVSVAFWRKGEFGWGRGGRSKGGAGSRVRRRACRVFLSRAGRPRRERPIRARVGDRARGSRRAGASARPRMPRVARRRLPTLSAHPQPPRHRRRRR